MSSRASINFFNDEAIKDEHINWEKKNLGDGTIDWYIQSILYHIYNVILLNLTHVKAFQTTHDYSILIRCIITFFIHRQQFIFVNHVNTYFKPCILLITHKGLGKVATLQMDWKKTHAPSSWRMPFVWMELYIEKVINCGYFAHTKWVQKVRYVVDLTSFFLEFTSLKWNYLTCSNLISNHMGTTLWKFTPTKFIGTFVQRFILMNIFL